MRAREKKCLWILLIVIVFSVVVVSVPVRGSESVRVYVSMPGAYIPGKPKDTTFPIDIYIESPPEWENTADGIVGWAFNVKVNPAVLEPVSVSGAMLGYFLYDFIDKYFYYGHEPQLLYKINKTAGLFYDVAEMIFAWEELGVGAGGSGKLCTLMIKSLSQTAYSRIDITDAYYYTIADKFPVDIVDDGHYNELVGVHDIAVAGITPITDLYKKEVYPGWIIGVNVTMKNEGDFTETFDVTLTYNVTITIGTKTVADLAPAEVRNVTFTWNTAGLTPSLTKMIKAEADVLPDETDIDDNFLSISVKVKLKGDVDGSGKVDFRDLFDLAKAYGSVPGASNWNQQCDFDQTKKVDFRDLFDLAANYGKTY